MARSVLLHSELVRWYDSYICSYMLMCFLTCEADSYRLSQNSVLLTQTSMNVRMMSSTTAMRMQTALTLGEVSPAPATLATLEMESTAQVSYAS